MFEFNPDDAKEKVYECLPTGEYEIVITDVEERVSKAGNDMIRLGITAYGEDGTKVFIYDYIVNPSSLWKLKSICRCMNIDFDGTLDEQLLIDGRMKAKIKFVKATDKYPEKNTIDRYLEGLDTAPKKEQQTPTKPAKEDIPF